MKRSDIKSTKTTPGRSIRTTANLKHTHKHINHMKKYTVNCQNGRFFEGFTIQANNYAEAVELGRRQCRLEGIRFLSVRLKK